jgi:FkbH-like protein
VDALIEDRSAFTLQVRLKDKFSDLGMIGVIIAKPSPNERAVWDIDTWLMSCRVLGRKIEMLMLTSLMAAASRNSVHKLRGLYIPTAKNGMVSGHFSNLGFAPAGQGESGSTCWEYELASFVPPSLPIRVE